MPTTVPLLTASPFAILAGSGITFAGAVNTTTIHGNIGTFPTTTITGIGNAVLIGTNHAGDATTQQAKLDLAAAYNFAATQVGAVTVATELGSTTKTPGVYNSAAGTFGITGTLTLDAQGDPNAVFIFQMGTTLITAASSNVVLINSAQAAKVFWQVGSSATLGISSHLEGNVLALTSITGTTSATVNGRLLARNGAVTLDTNVVLVPASTPVSTTSDSTNTTGDVYSVDFNTVKANSACFSSGCIGDPGRQAIDLYLLIQTLKAVGGADYSVAGGLTALQVAAAQWNFLSYDEREGIELWLDLQNAVFAGADVSQDARTLFSETACYRCLNKELTANLLSYLKAQLSTF